MLFRFRNNPLENRQKMGYKQHVRTFLWVFRVPKTEQCATTMEPERAESKRGSGMDVNKMLAELRQEREQIEEAIIILERLARGRGKRRGRPPLWMSQAAPVKRRGRPPGSKNRPKEERAAVA